MSADTVHKDSANGIGSLLKNTFLMGGTQAVHIVATLVKAKIVAVIIGLAGTGLSSVYWTATSWIQQLASLGFPMAAVKDIAGEGEEVKRLRLISLVKGFFFVAANVAALLCVLLSPILSLVSFADYSHWWDFTVMSAFVWFSVMGAGELTVMQGMNLVRPLFKASIIGSITGVLGAIPFYYFMGLRGIVWALVTAVAATYFCLRFMLNRTLVVKRSSVRETWKARSVISETVKSGLVIFLGGIIGAVANFAVISVVRAKGGLEQVGSYQSAWNMICQISAVVFAAMAVDYFPKLAASGKSEMNGLVEDQIFIGVGLTVPIMCVLMVASPFAVEILLSSEYLVIIPLLKWFAVAMVFKAVSYPLGFIALAKARRKLYFKIEVVTLNAVYLLGLLTGYLTGGLAGIGIAMVAIYAVDIIIYAAVAIKCFGLRPKGLLLGYMTAGMAYTILVFHLTSSDIFIDYPYAIYLLVALSMLFPLGVFKKMKKRKSLA